jgi:hypothetical protein
VLLSYLHICRGGLRVQLLAHFVGRVGERLTIRQVPAERGRCLLT